MSGNRSVLQLGLALPDLILHVVRGDGEPRHIPGDRVFTVDHVMFGHRSLEVSSSGKEESINGLTDGVEVGHHQHP